MAKLFAAFPEGTTGKEIVDFWVAEMEEDLLAKDKKKKEEERRRSEGHCGQDLTKSIIKTRQL